MTDIKQVCYVTDEVFDRFGILIRALAFPRKLPIFTSYIPHPLTMDSFKPKGLRRGDLIGLVTPASTATDPARIERGVQYLERLGYHVLLAPNANRMRGYLAGTDEERASDINSLFANPEVSAVFCIRGGYGSPRILSLLDYRLIARNPKIFVGYSDITAMQLAFWKKCRLVTFQGPMVSSDFGETVDPYAEEWFWKTITSTKAIGRLDIGSDSKTLRPGKARGRLLGGNFALLAALLGTKYQPDFTGSLLFLEDTDEEPYRIDRMFTHVRHASILDHSKALILGQFSNSDPSDPTKPSLTLAEVLDDATSWTEIPVLANLPFGHIPRKLTIPLGVNARLDAGGRTLDLTESAVR